EARIPMPDVGPCDVIPDKKYDGLDERLETFGSFPFTLFVSAGHRGENPYQQEYRQENCSHILGDREIPNIFRCLLIYGPVRADHPYFLLVYQPVGIMFSLVIMFTVVELGRQEKLKSLVGIKNHRK